MSTGWMKGLEGSSACVCMCVYIYVCHGSQTHVFLALVGGMVAQIVAGPLVTDAIKVLAGARQHMLGPHHRQQSTHMTVLTEPEGAARGREVCRGLVGGGVFLGVSMAPVGGCLSAEW